MLAEAKTEKQEALELAQYLLDRFCPCESRRWRWVSETETEIEMVLLLA